jgi:hypothetical protein
MVVTRIGQLAIVGSDSGYPELNWNWVWFLETESESGLLSALILFYFFFCSQHVPFKSQMGSHQVPNMFPEVEMGVRLRVN